jgi:hypothetical protein
MSASAVDRCAGSGTATQIFAFNRLALIDRLYGMKAENVFGQTHNASLHRRKEASFALYPFIGRTDP